MPPKLQFVAMAAVFLLPFVLINFCLALTRRGLIALCAAVGLGFGVLVFLRTGIGGSVAVVLARPVVTAPLLCAIFLIVLLYAVHDVRSARHRAWKPSQNNRQPRPDEFGRFCVDELSRHGWENRTWHADLRIAICRMERGTRRITAVFMVGGLEPAAVSSILNGMRWKPYGQTVLVSWRPPLPDFVAEAATFGWRAIDARNLADMDRAYDGTLPPAGSPDDQLAGRSIPDLFARTRGAAPSS